jgi:hypothetical protein
MEIRKVTSISDLRKFVAFPFMLFKGNAFWCPPLKFDEMNTLRRDKNPSFEFCEAEYWMAYQNGKPVGRIAGIINHKETELWNVRLVRFGWIDFIDDPEVSKALIETVSEWGKLKGMMGIHGPLGFNDMDPEGMLTEGFDEISGLSSIYNFPYYISHMVNMGFRKSADWIQFELQAPEKIPDKIERVNRLVLQKYNLHMLKARNSRDLYPYARKLFTMYNDAFRDIYGFTPLSQRQMDFYAKQYFSFIKPEFVSIILDAHDDIIGFGISMPSLGKALRKANGSLFPFGFIHLLRAMRKNDRVHMYLVGVRPDYQEKGVLALVYNELTRTYLEKGIKTGQTHLLLEDNKKVISIWKNYTGRVNIRRRCWIMNFK